MKLYQSVKRSKRDINYLGILQNVLYFWHIPFPEYYFKLKVGKLAEYLYTYNCQLERAANTEMVDTTVRRSTLCTDMVARRGAELVYGY